MYCNNGPPRNNLKVSAGDAMDLHLCTSDLVQIQDSLCETDIHCRLCLELCNLHGYQFSYKCLLTPTKM